MTQRNFIMVASPYVEYRQVSDSDLLKMTIMNKSVVADNGCWEWQGARSHGYGVMMRDRQRLRVHRVSYELWRGSIPNGMVMRHSCDNPCCVNPSHLEIGTQADNIQDTVVRGRHGRRKLTKNQVEAIRFSTESNRALADKHGVGIIAIRRAKSGETWRHIPSGLQTQGV
jgi:hypothetical protein